MVRCQRCWVVELKDGKVRRDLNLSGRATLGGSHATVVAWRGATTATKSAPWDLNLSGRATLGGSHATVRLDRMETSSTMFRRSKYQLVSGVASILAPHVLVVQVILCVYLLVHTL